MDLILGLDIQNKQLLNPVTGAPVTLPPFTKRETLNLVLQGMQLLNSGDYQLVPIAYDTIKVGIGLLDAPPMLGAYLVSVEGHSTIPLAHNSSLQFIENQLNALESVMGHGGLKVLPFSSPYLFAVAWNNEGVTVPITITNLTLFPRCFTRVIAWPQENRTLFLVKIFQAPLAFCDQFALPSSPAVTCVSVRAGNDTRNEVQRINVPSNSQGQFSATFIALSTLIIPVASVTAAAIQSALNGLYSDGVQRFVVTQPGAGYFYVEFVGPLAAAAQPLLTITMESQPPLITPTGVLDLKSPGFDIALNGAAQIPMVLELEIINGTASGTPIQQEVIIRNSMIDADMALAVDPRWLADQTSRVDVPNNPEQAVAIGLLGYEEPEVGDAVAHEFTINHNLGTKNVFIEVIENATDIRLPDNEYIASAPNPNQVFITYLAGPPSLHQYRILVSSAYATSYLPQLTLAIDDIAGLRAALNALSLSGSPFDLWPTIPLSKLPEIPFSQMTGTLPAGMLPANVALLDANGYLPLANLSPYVPRILPDGSLAVSLDGKSWTTLLSPDGKLDAGIFGDLSKVPSFVSSVLSVLAGNGVTPTGVITIPFQEISQVIGYRGAALTPDPLLGLKDSQLPMPRLLLPGDASFDKELWRISINDKMLTTGRTLTTDWEL